MRKTLAIALTLTLSAGPAFPAMVAARRLPASALDPQVKAERERLLDEIARRESGFQSIERFQPFARQAHVYWLRAKAASTRESVTGARQEYEDWLRIYAEPVLTGRAVAMPAVVSSRSGRVTPAEADRFNQPRLDARKVAARAPAFEAKPTGFSHWDSDGRPVFHSDAAALAGPRAFKGYTAPARRNTLPTRGVPAIKPAVYRSAEPKAPRVATNASLSSTLSDIKSKIQQWGGSMQDAIAKILAVPAGHVRAFVQNVRGLIQGDRSEDRRYATRAMALGLYKVALDLNQKGAPPLKFGDISQEGGGRISGHASHTDGNNADVRLYNDLRLDTELLKAATRSMRVKQFYLNQSRITPLCQYMKTNDGAAHEQFCGYNGAGALLRAWRGHTTHVHIRIH